MNSAETVFRTTFGKFLPPNGLRALLAALDADDPRLIQGSTTTPPPLMCVQNWPVECGCALSFIGVVENGGFCPTGERGDMTAVARHCTVGRAEEFFATACFDADRMAGEPAACRHFLNWYDDTPRPEMRRELARWVRESLAERGESHETIDHGPAIVFGTVDRPTVDGEF